MSNVKLSTVFTIKNASGNSDNFIQYSPKRNHMGNFF